MTTTGSGRPRDPHIDAEVLAAARELLVDVGFDQLSMRSIAARAGVSRAAIDRRWDSKAQLVLDAVLGVTPDLAPFEGADREGWIRWVVTGSSELFRRPEVREAVPGLLTTLRDQEDLRNTLWRGFSGPSSALFAQSESPPDDLLDARALLVLGAGAALFLSLIAVEEDTPEMRDRVLEILLPVARRRRTEPE
ncbi:helix-turn-helix domain-containing protein [Rhodococcus sp. NPDC058514]|uniref:TetR/AcrR family transcriptional regulator n=1 Tax=unclassified Rhodococcus (in: high G+C Gram-positive bacteria) TaxID=192944 RepID=UPI0036500DFA